MAKFPYILLPGHVKYTEGDRIHRTDGPAIHTKNEDSDGYEVYVINDVVYRADGPAIIFPNGTQVYCTLRPNPLEKRVPSLRPTYEAKTELQRILQQRLERSEKSDVITPPFNDTRLMGRFWYVGDSEENLGKMGNNNWKFSTMGGKVKCIPHRLDGPAIIYEDGTEYYFVRGMLSNLNGPAIVRPNEDNEFYVNDTKIDESRYGALIDQLTALQQKRQLIRGSGESLEKLQQKSYDVARILGALRQKRKEFSQIEKSIDTLVSNLPGVDLSDLPEMPERQYKLLEVD